METSDVASSPALDSEEWKQRSKGFYFPPYVDAEHRFATTFVPVTREVIFPIVDDVPDAPSEAQEIEEEVPLGRMIGGLLLNRPTSFKAAALADASTAPWTGARRTYTTATDPRRYTGINPIEPWIRVVVQYASSVKQRAKFFFNKLIENHVTKSNTLAPDAGQMMQLIVGRWGVVPESPSSDFSTAPILPVSTSTQSPSEPPIRLNRTSPSAFDLAWIQKMGSWALDTTLATPRFLPAISEAAVHLWEGKSSYQIQAFFNIDKPFARPFHKSWSRVNDGETSIQGFMAGTWMQVINAFLAAAVKAKFGNDTAAQIFRDKKLPPNLKYLWRSNRRDCLKVTEGIYEAPSAKQEHHGPIFADTSDEAETFTCFSDNSPSMRYPHFLFVVQQKGHEPRIIAVMDLWPWVTLQFLAYVLFELAKELVTGTAKREGEQRSAKDDAEGGAQTALHGKGMESRAADDEREKYAKNATGLQTVHGGSNQRQDGHMEALRGFKTKGGWLLDQLASHASISRAPLYILLTTYQVLFLQSRLDKETRQYDLHLHRTVFSMAIPDTFKDETASVTADPGCPGACGHRFTVETSVNPICALFAVLMGGVQLYVEERDSYVDDLTADLARMAIIPDHGQGESDDEASACRYTRHDDGAEASRGPSIGGTSSSTSHLDADSADHHLHAASSDRDRSCEQLAVVYRQWSQADGRDGSLHVGCLMTHDAAMDIFEKTQPFCCRRTSLFSQQHSSEGISAEGECAVKGHTSIVVKFAKRFDAEDCGEDSDRDEQAETALQQDADNLDSIRKASREIAHLVPRPLGTFLTADHGHKGFVYTNAGWALSESGAAGVLDLDKEGRKAILAAIRYVFQALHRSGWIHGDVAEHNICMRLCHRYAKDSAAAGLRDESVEREIEGTHGPTAPAISPSNSPRQSGRPSKGGRDARRSCDSPVQSFTRVERPSTPDYSTMSTRFGGLAHSTSNTSVSTGAGKDRDFPREACVIKKDRILQIRLIDFSTAKRLSGSELAAACKEEMRYVNDMLEDFDSHLARAWERNRAAEKRAASAHVASPRP